MISGSEQVIVAEILVAVAVPALKTFTGIMIDSPPSAKPSSSSPAGANMWVLYKRKGVGGVFAG